MKRLFLILIACLCLSGCASKTPTVEELFANAYGEDFKSATFYQYLIMEGAENDVELKLGATLTIENVFNKKSHINGVFEINDETAEYDSYSITEDGKTVTYIQNVFGVYDKVRETGGFSDYVPTLDSSLYEGLKVHSEKDVWLVTGTARFSQVAMSEFFDADCDVDVAFEFYKSSGLVKSMTMNLPEVLESGGVRVDSMWSYIVVDGHNNTDFDVSKLGVTE